MDAKASLLILALSLPMLWLGGCVESPPPAGPPSAYEDGSDPSDPSTAAVSGYLTFGQQPAATQQPTSKHIDDTQRQLPDPADAATEVEGVIPGELLVTFDPSVGDEERAAILTESGLQEIERSPSGLCRVFCPARSKLASRQAKAATVGDAAALLNRRGVLRASPNLRRYIAAVPNDHYFPAQWHYSLINLPEAWDLTTGSDSVVVAVVDTGIVSTHPDLQGRLVPGYDFISDPASARDGDGRDSDPEDMGDEYNGPGRSSFHGTHVAGTIGAATNNGIGVAGVTWNTKIMPVRALGVNGGSSFDVAEAIRYAAGLPNVSGTLPAQPARIINLSVAGAPGEPASSEETAAIREATQAGALVICAAGNGGSSKPAWPAATPEALSVGAVDTQAVRTSYSNYGATLDLMAPGGMAGVDLNGDGYSDSVLSTGAAESGGQIITKYLFSNGTSMAAPHVAGVAALMLAVNPGLTVAEMRSILLGTARDLGVAGPDPDYGHGLVDAAAAVREAWRRAGHAGGQQAVPSEDSGDSSGGEQIYVLALKADTLEPVAQDETSAAEGYAFNLVGLASGAYLIYAGTDRDGDGFICDAGDLCGAIPTVTTPGPISLEAGERIVDLGLEVTELPAGDGAQGPVQPLHLPRMR